MSVVRRLPVVADLTLVTAGAMTANVAGYLLQLLASRWLGVTGYSEFASLLAVQSLCAVPAIALQNVVARELVRGASVAVARQLTLRCAALVTVVAALLVPIVAAVLKVGVGASAAALCMTPVLVMLSGEQGILQGRSRFRELAWVLGGATIARVTPALALLAAGAGTAPALWAAAAGLGVATAVARRATDTHQTFRRPTGNSASASAAGVQDTGTGRSRRSHPTDNHHPESGEHEAGTTTNPTSAGDALAPSVEFDSLADEAVSAVVRAPGAGVAGRVRAYAASVGPVMRAGQVQAALIALSSADLIVSRIVLSEQDAGLYALGAIATKIAFWLPQAVGVVLYPRMAEARHSARAVRAALAVLTAVGAVAVAVAAAAAPLAPMLAGQDYAPVQGLLWLFALNGALLAVLQGALLSAIATDRTAPAAITWIGLAAGVAAMLACAQSVAGLIGIATATAAVTTAVIAAIAVRTVRNSNKSSSNVDDNGNTNSDSDSGSSDSRWADGGSSGGGDGSDSSVPGFEARGT
ncbi:polysaccharide biosynthesis protein [Nocardia huaxiensis]|uniref:polysaccharide biosynthesis protein n=1 Tax=Nocardia huaxiensis TaxID=2755382 RepID=UPI001E2A5609|nr:polysaccharide biosynthesis protein [Nocardia huaxiensis]UFS94389.1 polysaccharide biosynthesis protein [Nocardia huaxiensis]